ncbi:hypothetical protein BpHYR1_004850 [Brachionus plicatilis]|uniref:Uncharacterized protein n=1 Tax=Brachionus plicatilis TaxID=10195 RepID=A0A3M7PYU8_BRAPC|nr:hypothetical protein BpHYR1_004850 [Brachionus plicatilis]
MFCRSELKPWRLLSWLSASNTINLLNGTHPIGKRLEILSKKTKQNKKKLDYNHRQSQTQHAVRRLDQIK